MKLIPKYMCVGIFAMAASANAQSVLTGDTKLACEAVLCLSTGKRPSECGPSIAKFRTIKHKKFKDTINGRRNFLALCPSGSNDPMLASLLDAHAYAEQYCDPWYLNLKGVGHPGMAWGENGLDGQLANVGYGAGMAPPGWLPNPISNVLPPNCQALADHPYTFEAAPKYVGTPELYGFWTTWDDYPAKSAQYQANIPAMLAQKQAELEALNSSQGGAP